MKEKWRSKLLSGAGKEKLTKKLVSWRSKLLSGAGKEILIKAVAQTVPIYAMNCYKLPIGLCDDLHQLCAGFWWGDSDEKNKIHWRSWERLCVPKQDGGMGFKNLHWFNLAMLAKQGWRLLQNPDSLIARLYKVVYYPDDDFMKAQLGTSPSFSWRSILEAREVLVQGLRWQVGSGETIDIWKDKWIPDLYPRCPSSPQSADAPQFVYELIDPFTRRWDQEKLETFFAPVDVDLILGIPLSTRVSVDRPIWHCHKKGIFTTSSAYYVARDIALGVILAPTSPPDPYTGLWKAIWNSNVPRKVAMHAWRTCAGILPTRDDLSRKGYMGDMSCLLCNHAHEDGVHLFVHCPYAQEAWSAASLQPPVGATNMKEHLLAVSQNVPKKDFAQVLMVLWSIWTNRNSQLWENKRHRPVDAVLLSFGWHNDFLKANDNVAAQPRQVMRWTKPEQGWVKCNSDGAYIPGSRKGGSGVVIRNETSDFMAGAAKPCLQLTSPFHAELLALLEGMKLAETLNYSKVIFETDCLLLVHALNQDTADISSLGLILDEAKEIMNRQQDFRLTHAQRECNRVAHILANHAHTTCESNIWFANAPVMIRDVILNDCNH